MEPLANIFPLMSLTIKHFGVIFAPFSLPSNDLFDESYLASICDVVNYLQAYLQPGQIAS